MDELKEYTNTKTCLVSFIIKQGYNKLLSCDMLKQEIKTASNIKDKNTRKNVIETLKHCRDMVKTNSTQSDSLDTGIAIFAGYCF